jgi:hypothetical protein
MNNGDNINISQSSKFPPFFKTYVGFLTKDKSGSVMEGEMEGRKTMSNE